MMIVNRKLFARLMMLNLFWVSINVAQAETEDVLWLRSIEQEILRLQDDVNMRQRSDPRSSIRYEVLQGDLDIIVRGLNASIEKNYQRPRDIHRMIDGSY